jgi:hypothetical protein
MITLTRPTLARIDDPGSEPIEPTDIPPRNPGEPLWTPGDDPTDTVPEVDIAN